MQNIEALTCILVETPDTQHMFQLSEKEYNSATTCPSENKKITGQLIFHNQLTYDAQRSKRALNGKCSQFYFLRFLDVAIFNLFSDSILFAKFICLTPQ